MQVCLLRGSFSRLSQEIGCEEHLRKHRDVVSNCVEKDVKHMIQVKPVKSVLKQTGGLLSDCNSLSMSGGLNKADENL